MQRERFLDMVQHVEHFTEVRHHEQLWGRQVGHGVGLQPALREVKRLLQVALPQMNYSQTGIDKRAQI
jgi:hypothetical protein